MINLKFILTLFSLLTFFYPVCSQETGILFLWELSNDRKAWEAYGDKKYQQKYVGITSNGKPNGKGDLSHPNGNSVNGIWRNGNEWNTKHLDKGGNVIGGYIKGQFIEGSNLKIKTVLFLRKEKGRWSWHDNGDASKDYKYEGIIENGKPNGRGIYTSPNGNQYLGEFKNGKKHGHGTYTYSNGNKYTGQWKDGKKNALGTFIYKSGSRYEGEFKDDKKHGKGTLISKNGDKYVGRWVNGKKSGFGIVTYASGSMYEGQFKEDKKHGEGTFRWKNGAQRSGEFKNSTLWNISEFDKKGEIIKKWVNGVKVVDKKKENILFLRNSNGQWIWDKKGDEMIDGKYVGSINKNGIPNGAGVITFPDGKKYEGEWKNSKKHGKGTFTFPDGGKLVGIFKEDKPWDITDYDEAGKIKGEYLNGIRQ